MSSIQKIQHQSGRRYKAVLKSGSRVLKNLHPKGLKVCGRHNC